MSNMFIYSVTNGYRCVPSSSSASPGNLTGWMDGSIDCSVAKIEVHSFGCDTVVPTEILVSNQEGPILNTDGPEQPHMFYYEGLEKNKYPTHDSCGRNSLLNTSIHQDPRGAIYIR